MCQKKYALLQFKFLSFYYKSLLHLFNVVFRQSQPGRFINIGKHVCINVKLLSNLAMGTKRIKRKKSKAVYHPFLWKRVNCLKVTYMAFTRRQSIFYHYASNSSKCSFDQYSKNERLSQPWSYVKLRQHLIESLVIVSFYKII